MPYTEDTYFSNHCTKVLSIGGHHCTATDMRHAFSTAWRDFLLVRGGGQVDQELEAAAAALMGNKPASWDACYDDKARARPWTKMMALYPAFRAWVKAEHASKRQEQARDPLA